jgi:hypothetical protein
VCALLDEIQAFDNEVTFTHYNDNQL